MLFGEPPSILRQGTSPEILHDVVGRVGKLVEVEEFDHARELLGQHVDFAKERLLQVWKVRIARVFNSDLEVPLADIGEVNIPSASRIQKANEFKVQLAHHRTDLPLLAYPI